MRAHSGRRRGWRTEVHLRRGRNCGLVFHGEIRLYLVPEYLGGQVDRKAADIAVVILHRLDVAVACHGDAVFGAFELRLQVLEQAIGFQVRVIFRHRHQTRQRAGKFALRSLILGERRRIVGVDGDLPHFRARLGDFAKHLFLVRGITLHRRDQVRHQVGAALVLVDHFRPRGLDRLVLGLDLVVTTARQQAAGKHQHATRNGEADGAHGNSPFQSGW